MKITLLDDYAGVAHTLPCFAQLAEHEVEISTICTPHLGYAERGQLESCLRQQFERMLAYAAGKPIDVVGPEVLAER